MKKIILPIIFIVFLSALTYGKINFNLNKNIISSKSNLDLIKNIKIDENYSVEISDINAEDELTTYIYKLNKKNEELFRLIISNESFEIYIPKDRTDIIYFEDTTIKKWFTGSIIHFLWHDNDKFFYIRGDVNKIVTYEQYLKIVEYFITHL